MRKVGKEDNTELTICSFPPWLKNIAVDINLFPFFEPLSSSLALYAYSSLEANLDI
jgi:hypothetical protein